MTMGQISFVVRLVNNVGTPVPLSGVTMRYWFTADGTTPFVDCDYAHISGTAVSCDNIAPKPPAPAISTFKPVTPALPKADTYLEIAFNATAGTLDAFHSDKQQDQIQLRIHDVNFKPMMQANDYSFNCSMLNMEIESPLITAYVAGVLKFGTEPGGSAPPVDAGSAPPVDANSSE
jgi:hypothetical protein